MEWNQWNGMEWNQWNMMEWNGTKWNGKSFELELFGTSP